MSRWCRAAFSALLALAVSGQLTREEDFVCPKPDGYFANPEDCQTFYNCRQNLPYRFNCPSRLFYDDIKKRCENEVDAVCGPISTTPGPSTTEDPNKAGPCDPTRCALPACFCSDDGTSIPGGLTPEETPQMIILNFDGAINRQNYLDYLDLFNDTAFFNPNGCPMRGTFFVSHEYTDYQTVQDLYHRGHEIGVYGTSGRDLSVKSYDDWVQEMVGMRYILGLYGNVSLDYVLGTRSPQLRTGHNQQFRMMKDYSFLWDSTVAVPPLKVPVWPYTLDYKIPHECRSGTCPTSRFPGVWEIPLNAHFKNDQAGRCQYMEQCALNYYSLDRVVEWYKADFNRHYKQNRAPYVLSFHTTYFNDPKLVRGLEEFLLWTQTKDDVWFVTMTQALEWMTQATPLSDITSLESWDCQNRYVPPPACKKPTSCPLQFEPPEESDYVAGTRYMATCMACPPKFPWLGDVDGDGGDPDVFEKVA